MLNHGLFGCICKPGVVRAYMSLCISISQCTVNHGWSLQKQGHLEPFGAFWDQFRQFGTIWDHLRIFETIWGVFQNLSSPFFLAPLCSCPLVTKRLQQVDSYCFECSTFLELSGCQWGGQHRLLDQIGPVCLPRCFEWDTSISGHTKDTWITWHVPPLRRETASWWPPWSPVCLRLTPKSLQTLWCERKQETRTRVQAVTRRGRPTLPADREDNFTKWERTGKMTQNWQQVW